MEKLTREPGAAATTTATATRDGAKETKAMAAVERTTTIKTYVATACRQKRVGDEA